MAISLLDDFLKTFEALINDPKYSPMIKMLQMIRSQLALMECFVEDLLNYNMIQSGAFNLKPIDFDPLDVLEFIKSTFKEKFRQKNLKISAKYVKKSKQKNRKQNKRRPRL